jgi:hypothetical protein
MNMLIYVPVDTLSGWPIYVGTMENARGMMCVAVEAIEDAVEAEVDVDSVVRWHLWNST